MCVCVCVLSMLDMHQANWICCRSVLILEFYFFFTLFFALSSHSVSIVHLWLFIIVIELPNAEDPLLLLFVYVFIDNLFSTQFCLTLFNNELSLGVVVHWLLCVLSEGIYSNIDGLS